MKRVLISVALALIFALSAGTTSAESVFAYENPNVAHPGGEMTPLAAYERILKDPDHMIIVDVRTRGEYQFVGHPVGAYLLPYKFLGTVFRDKEYELIDNKQFSSELMTRFNAKTDTLFFLCRSGSRAAQALGEAVQAGWPAKQAYVILGGFEGNKTKDSNSIYNGQRNGGGWKNEGLPWTYSLDQKHIY